jgi:hypothetical protein
MTIDLTTNKISKRSNSLLSNSSAFFKPSHFKLNYGDYYEFDSLNYKYNFSNGFYVYKNVAKGYNHIYTYLVDCVPFIVKGDRYYVESFKCMGEIEITARSLYDFHCDYESIVKFALNKLSLRKEFFKYFNEYKFNLNYDFLVAFLCYFKNNKLLNILLDYDGELVYPELLLNIDTRTIEQKDKKLNYISNYIKKYHNEKLIYKFLIKYDINPIPYIDYITNEEFYLDLAYKYSVLRDKGKMTSDRCRFLFAYRFGGMPQVSEEKYSFLTAKKISPNRLLRDNIQTPVWAYKWASEVKTSITEMRQIIFNSIVSNCLLSNDRIKNDKDAVYAILFAAMVDQITPSHPYYDQYLTIVNNNCLHVKAMFLWLYYIDASPIVNFFYLIDQTDVGETGSSNKPILISDEEQGWIVLLDAFYGPDVSKLFNEEYSRDYDILKHVTNPYYMTEQFRLCKNGNPGSSLDTILTYQDTIDISQWIYEYVKNQTDAISISAELSKYLEDPYWRMRTEFLIQKKIIPGSAS